MSPVQPSSAAGTPGPEQTRTNNLLSLLKFNGQSSQPEDQPSPMTTLQNVGAAQSPSTQIPNLPIREASNARPLSASDLMANLQGKPTASDVRPTSIASSGSDKLQPQTSPHSNPQDFLLNLLTKPKSQSSQVPTNFGLSQLQDVKKGAQQDLVTQNTMQSSAEGGQLQRESALAGRFGERGGTSELEAPQPTKSSRFDYVNPFDQLHSSSPLNRKSNSSSNVQSEPKKIEILKHDRASPPASEKTPTGPDSRSRKLEDGDTVAVLGLFDGESKNQTVSEALESVGQKVNKQVEQALAETDKQSEFDRDMMRTQYTALDGDPDSKQTASGSNWESAEDDLSWGEKGAFKVEVYNFPMKPFVSLQIKKTATARQLRQEHFMVIAQLKKDFDQIDRCLVTASQTHIVYAQVATKKDNGGFRIIRQDTGDHKQVFRTSGERIFHVQLCSSAVPGYDVEAVLGTGVNGSVFWTSLAKSHSDLFPEDDVEGHGFIMPPVATAEENTSGSPVKTRAKLSSRHPDFFAVARGKQIFIISPPAAKDRAYCNPTTRKINTEKYLTEHSLKINTGKAGKDFCFSEDDTVIVSLDKNGRFKFWDIRDLTGPLIDGSEAQQEAVELRDPMWTMNAAASGSKPEEKPSVSSIMFLDKERPVLKGSALRYLIIGFKQNHILQLWDLGLSKAVQEIRFPHEKDSDAICSISYHPKTGIIAIGHPTRNSIYFIHLSAPKYNIPHMEQARYINMLARGDSALPKPESTAIMSGLREFSFAKVGQLRSIDMLKTPVDNATERNSIDETLFELYVMHAKGVIGVSIKREDLGWDAQSKMIEPKDALEGGIIEVSDLVQPPKLPASSAESSVADNTPRQAPKPAAAKKPEPAKPAPTMKVDSKKDPSPSPATAANSSRQNETVSEQTLKPTPEPLPLGNPPLMTADSYATAAQRARSPSAETTPVSATHTAKQKASLPKASTKPELTFDAGAFQLMLNKQFESLYQRIDSDKRVQDAAAGAKQEALLRLVSSTLTENVDRSLSNIISTRIEKDVVPTLTDVTSKLLDRKISEMLPQQLGTTMSNALAEQLPTALQQALKDKEVHRLISETTSNAITSKVQQQVSALLQQSVPTMVTEVAQKMIADLEARTNKQLHEAEMQREQDESKIEELSNLVRSLSTTVHNMADSQSAFQEQILKMQRENKAAAKDGSAKSAAPALNDAQESQAEPEDAEVTRLTQMLTSGQWEEATIQVSCLDSIVWDSKLTF